MTPEQCEVVRLSESGLNRRQIAEQLGVSMQTVKGRMARAKRHMDTRASLEGAGYDLERGELTDQEAWDGHKREFERTLARNLAADWQIIKLPPGPFVLFHITDPHVDDPGSALNLIRDDLARSHEIGAIVCHGGDLLNNWPEAGRLARLWAEQGCTKAVALQRARYYIQELAKPRVWVDGNHEEMNPYLADLIGEWLPSGVVRNHWAVKFVVQAGPRDVRCVLSHKLQKGKSWFHNLHGHLREMLEGDPADVLMDGHIHCNGLIEHSLPERGHHAMGVASAGYKLHDRYAQRISRGALPKIRGRAHWIVCDPFAEMDEDLAKAFTGFRQAEAYLGALQNVRAI